MSAFDLSFDLHASPSSTASSLKAKTESPHLGVHLILCPAPGIVQCKWADGVNVKYLQETALRQLSATAETC